MVQRSTVAVAVLIAFAGAARAESTASYTYVTDGAAGGPVFVRQVVPATSLATGELARTRTIYLNHQGAMLRPGVNDSQANTSTLVSRPTQVPGWSPSTADWDATVACMKKVWSRFDVTVTDVDPGAAPHVEALFAAWPADIGMADNIGGISPFTTNCSVIESSIVFVFASNLGNRTRTICEVMSQEIAHSYGLDHELLAADPMTYLGYVGNREFQDRDAACGESVARPCGISGITCRATQNSVQLLLARLGAANRDNQPPSVAITAPAQSATVSAGFAITAVATDNVVVKTVAFYVDGDLVATRAQAPYQLDTDPALVKGAHTIIVEATDGDGNTALEQRDIVIAGATPPSDPLVAGCSASGRPPVALIAIVALCLVRRRRRVAPGTVGAP